MFLKPQESVYVLHHQDIDIEQLIEWAKEALARSRNDAADRPFVNFDATTREIRNQIQ